MDTVSIIYKSIKLFKKKIELFIQNLDMALCLFKLDYLAYILCNFSYFKIHKD